MRLATEPGDEAIHTSTQYFFSVFIIPANKQVVKRDGSKNKVPSHVTNQSEIFYDKSLSNYPSILLYDGLGAWDLKTWTPGWGWIRPALHETLAFYIVAYGLGLRFIKQTNVLTHLLLHHLA